VNEPTLLSETTLANSSVVANNAMNRKRGLDGANSYVRELGFSPREFLQARLDAQRHSSWLDLCCGEGRALLDATREFPEGSVRLVGVDLVDYFAPVPPGVSGVELLVSSLADWEPTQKFDLITCVHGLHYVGDKLGLLSHMARWLTPSGRLAAHLDSAHVLGVDARKLLRQAGFTYNSRRGLALYEGLGEPIFPVRFLGADDTVGPNATGQPAVGSHYAMLATA
jgi:SAM-dependent methyltransferase